MLINAISQINKILSILSEAKMIFSFLGLGLSISMIRNIFQINNQHKCIIVLFFNKVLIISEKALSAHAKQSGLQNI